MFWDLNDNLKPLKKDFRIYLVDVVGQPGLSSGNSPDVKTDEFGLWICEVLDGLKLEKVNIAGASFGGLLGMKLANVAPERITNMVLLNPIGFGYITLAPESLFLIFCPFFLRLIKTSFVSLTASSLQEEKMYQQSARNCSLKSFCKLWKGLISKLIIHIKWATTS
jgi:pimeloyl-ACP methyl ester carboxylesterase